MEGDSVARPIRPRNPGTTGHEVPEVAGLAVGGLAEAAEFGAAQHPGLNEATYNRPATVGRPNPREVHAPVAANSAAATISALPVPRAHPPHRPPDACPIPAQPHRHRCLAQRARPRSLRPRPAAPAPSSRGRGASARTYPPDHVHAARHGPPEKPPAGRAPRSRRPPLPPSGGAGRSERSLGAGGS